MLPGSIAFLQADIHLHHLAHCPEGKLGKEIVRGIVVDSKLIQLDEKIENVSLKTSLNVDKTK